MGFILQLRERRTSIDALLRIFDALTVREHVKTDTVQLETLRRQLDHRIWLVENKFKVSLAHGSSITEVTMG